MNELIENIYYVFSFYFRLRPEDVGYDPQPNSAKSSSSLKSMSGAADCLGDPLVSITTPLKWK